MEATQKSLGQLIGINELLNAIRYARRLREVRQVMSLGRTELEELQLERLKEMLTYAYENVELYNRKWRQAGVGPQDVKTLADLKKLPITTKDDFRHNFPDAILSRQLKARDCFILGTSGSTGSPVRVFLDLDKAMVDFALSLPRYMAGKPPITIVSAMRDFLLRRNVMYMAIMVDEPTAYETLHSRVFRTMRHTVVDSLKPADVHIREINRRKPKYLYAYPSTIRNICILARQKRIRMHRPELVMCAGEVVDNHLRGLVRDIFGSEFLDVYGSIENGFIACECTRHEGMHIFTWKVVLELIDEHGNEVPDGDSGRVIITDLYNRGTPIIRYSGLGDYAVRKAEPCSCGRPLPVLGRVEGRMVDSVVLPDGQVVHPYSLTLALEDIPHLSKFQVRQEERDYMRILLVRDKVPEAEGVSFAADGDIGRVILDRFNTILKNQVKIDLVTTDDIPKRPGSNKYATVVSMVKGV